MINTPRRLALRWAAIFALVHAVVVFAASAVNNLLWGKTPFAWEAGRFLRSVDFPVFWAIDRGMREITSLPRGWPLDWLWTSVLIQSFYHAAIGGVFYALLAATVAFLLGRRPRRRGAVAQHGRASQETSA